MYKYVLCLLLILMVGCSALHDIKSSNITTPDHQSLETIPLELTTHLGDQQPFIEGNEIQFLLSIGSDAFIYMYYIDSENNITQILPNQNQSSNYYSAGYFLTVPEYDNGYRFTVSKPFGQQTIWVFASDQSITFNNPSNSIGSIRQKIKQSSNQEYGEYKLNISTQKNNALWF